MVTIHLPLTRAVNSSQDWDGISISYLWRNIYGIFVACICFPSFTEINYSFLLSSHVRKPIDKSDNQNESSTVTPHVHLSNIFLVSQSWSFISYITLTRLLDRDDFWKQSWFREDKFNKGLTDGSWQPFTIHFNARARKLLLIFCFYGRCKDKWFQIVSSLIFEPSLSCWLWSATAIPGWKYNWKKDSVSKCYAPQLWWGIHPSWLLWDTVPNKWNLEQNRKLL